MDMKGFNKNEVTFSQIPPYVEEFIPSQAFNFNNTFSVYANYIETITS